MSCIAVRSISPSIVQDAFVSTRYAECVLIYIQAHSGGQSYDMVSHFVNHEVVALV
jgi:hypothetical protein